MCEMGVGQSERARSDERQSALSKATNQRSPGGGGMVADRRRKNVQQEGQSAASQLRSPEPRRPVGRRGFRRPVRAQA
jgi:hypothetical protein